MNNDDFPRDVHQDGETKDDFGATANVKQGRSASAKQMNPNIIMIQKDQIIQFQLAEMGKSMKLKFLDGLEKYLQNKELVQYQIYKT